MTRAVNMLAVLIAFFAFAQVGGAGGIERVQGPMVHAMNSVGLMESQHDRCRMAASCSLPCAQCAGLPTTTTNHADNRIIWFDLHRSLEKRPVPERLYRPPRPNAATSV